MATSTISKGLEFLSKWKIKVIGCLLKNCILVSFYITTFKKHVNSFEVVKSVAVENDQSSCVNWRERRAAVLICLFEGQEGELRVNLTKRSMKMASHPGIDFHQIDDPRWMLTA
jgi:hypothetical protein